MQKIIDNPSLLLKYYWKSYLRCLPILGSLFYANIGQFPIFTIVYCLIAFVLYPYSERPLIWLFTTIRNGYIDLRLLLSGGQEYYRMTTRLNEQFRLLFRGFLFTIKWFFTIALSVSFFIFLAPIGIWMETKQIYA